MNINDQVESEADLVLDVYGYASKHDLDISQKADVLKILKTLGKENIDNDQLKRLMIALDITDRRIRKDVAGRKRELN